MEQFHKPVFVREVIENISIIPGGVYADLTFGEGGHAALFLTQNVKKVFAMDRDQSGILRPAGDWLGPARWCGSQAHYDARSCDGDGVRR